MIETLKGQARHPTTEPGASLDALAALAEEMAAFRARLPGLVPEHEGEFVLIKGGEIVGIFDRHEAALREGYRRFGIAPFLVRRVAVLEPTVYLPNVKP
jgi:hypothetical protein